MPIIRETKGRKTGIFLIDIPPYLFSIRPNDYLGTQSTLNIGRNNREC